MAAVDVRSLDITETNRAVRELIATTANRRQRYMLEAYDRHRNLEHAGLGQPPLLLDGRDQVEPMYSYWAQTSQSIFYAEQESIAVGDSMIVSTMVGYQQVLGADLAAAGAEANAEAMYLLRGRVAMIWPYDERCRLVGENVWEFDEAEHALIELDPADVLSTERAAELLAPLIKPLPAFSEEMLPR